MELSKVTGINIKGANFLSETSLQMLSNKVPSLGLVYGKNGSGKSTISRGFSNIAGKVDDTIEVADPIDNDTNVVNLENENVSIHVFNETYVDENIKLRPDGEGLETIVVLGNAIGIEKDIENAQKAVDLQEKQVESQKRIVEKYNNEKDSQSPYYYLKRIKDALKGDDAWAGRDAKIRGLTRSTSVKEEKYKDFISRKPSKKRDELVSDFNQRYNDYIAAKSGVKKIEKKISIESYEAVSFDDNELIELLKKKIEKPSLNDREKYLLSLSPSWGSDHGKKIRDYFKEQSNDRCPYCLREIDKDYKEELFKSIESVLSKTVEEHQSALDSFYIAEFEFDFSEFSALNRSLIDESKECLRILNESIQQIQVCVKKKKDNVFEPIIEETFGIADKLRAFCKVLEKLELERVEYNKKAVDLVPIINDLNDINSDIAFYDIKEDYKKYQKALSNEKKELNSLSKSQSELDKKKKVLENYKDKKRDAKIALKEINNGLNYIFFSKGRLSIEMSGDQYYLKSRNQSVSPSKISVGERNAIALCYFFSEIMREKNENEVYTGQYLLVIDDPVSSFDMENRVGILSYLRYQINLFLSGNNETKVITLTHDLQTAFDIEKVYFEITDKFGISSGNRSKHIKIQELRNNELIKFEAGRRNEYSRLMVETYLFAIGANPEYDLLVGNSMRRIMEAFGTFMYKKGIENLSTSPEIKELLGVPFSEHFENLMYRLVLHGGSHNAERVRGMDSEDFFDYISEDEKKRTAQEILTFLYILDSRHVLEHLKMDSSGNELLGVENNLKQWKNNIKDLHDEKSIEVEE